MECRLTEGVRYTFTATEALRLIRKLEPHTVVPIHYEGWTHFKESRSEAERAFGLSGWGGRVQWLTPGQAITLEV